MTKITTEEKIERKVQQALQRKDFMQVLANKAVQITAIAVLCSGTVAFSWRFFLAPAVHQVALEDAKTIVSDSLQMYKNDLKYLQQDLSDIKNDLSIVKDYVINRRRR